MLPVIIAHDDNLQNETQSIDTTWRWIIGLAYGAMYHMIVVESTMERFLYGDW